MKMSRYLNQSQLCCFLLFLETPKPFHGFLWKISDVWKTELNDGFAEFVIPINLWKAITCKRFNNICSFVFVKLGTQKEITYEKKKKKKKKTS